MSVKYTVTKTREQAINSITKKRLEKVIKPMEIEIRLTLNLLSNEELEELLDTEYYDSKFENYEVVDNINKDYDLESEVN